MPVDNGGIDPRESGSGPIVNVEELSRQELRDMVRDMLASQRRLKEQVEELRHTNGELAESCRRLSRLHDAAPIGCFTFDPQGTILSVNRAGAALLGAARSRVLRKPFFRFIRQEDRKVLDRHIHNVLVSGSRDQLECELGLVPKDGTPCFVRLTSSAARDRKDRTIRIQSVVSDITAYKQTEEGLRQNRAVLKSIIDATDFMLVYLDPGFNFVWVNPSYADTCRMQPSEMAGRNHFELFPHPENEAIFRRVRDTGVPVFFKDKPFIFPDQPERGTTYWDWSLVPYKNEAGEVVGLVFSLRETTRYKRAVMNLAESEERFRLIAETSSDIIFLMDAEGRLTYCSPAISSLGHTDRIIGASFTEFIPPAQLPQAENMLRRIMAGEKIRLIELKVLQADRTCVDLEISATPVVRNGKVAGIQGIARDITERKHIENALRESRAQLRTTLENLTEGVIVADLQGNLIYWNPAAVAMHGFSAEEEYLRPLSAFSDTFELSAPDGKILPPEQWPMSRILRGETIQNYELQVRRSDLNLQRFYSYGGTLARDSGGQARLAILTLRDITERKLGEEKIRLHNAVLSGINRIFEAGLRCDTEKELARAALDIAKETTGSRKGFIAETGYNGVPHLLAGGDHPACSASPDDPPDTRPRGGEFAWTDLCRPILDSGKALYVNDPTAGPGAIVAPDGRPHPAPFLGTPLFHDGRIAGIIVVADRPDGYRAEDIHSLESLAQVFTETLFRFRTERALQASEARERQRAAEMAQLLNFTPIPIWIAHDPHCRILTSNLAAANLVGAPSGGDDGGPSRQPQSAVSMRHFRNGIELTPDEIPLLRAVAEGIRIKDVELDIVLPDGAVKRILGAAVPLFDNEGRVQGGIAAYMDITERKWMEEQLLQAKQEWEKTFDSVPDLIAILDNQHRIIRANRAMADRLGLTPGQCVSRKCFSCVHNENAPPENCPHVMTLKDGREHRAEVYEERLNGYFLVTTTPLYDEKGKMFGSVHVSRDITERKAAEEQIRLLNRDLQASIDKLEEVNRELARSNQDLQQFANIISHDLQEPLRTISSFLQLLSRRYADRLDDKATTFINQAVEGSAHMQQQLQDLLAFSRLGGGRLRLQPVSLNELVDGLLMNLKAAIEESRAEIQVDMLPEVHADKAQLNHLLQNLLTNALKFRSSEPPRIHIFSRRRGDEWIVCVRDNGIGIDPQHADRIFLIFQRLHRRGAYEGTGVGLAICKKIAERHGGRIWVESEPGRGALFCFTLPVHDPERQPA